MNQKDPGRVLQAVARDHVPEDIDLLPGILAHIEKGNRFKMKSTTKMMAAVTLVLLAIAALLVGLPAAAKAMQRLFGYIPNVGIVEKGAPIRVLAEPVTVTREGISVSVNSAILAADKTHLEYRIFGVPGSAYPNREDVAGCMDAPYLRLPDGKQLESINADFAPVPAGVNEAVFVMPCIMNTLPGKAPENWELSLKFIPAPPDLTLMPVVDIPATSQATSTEQLAAQATFTPGAVTQPVPVAGTPTAIDDQSVTVVREIETSDGYILIGEFTPQGIAEGQVEPYGEILIRDANGKKVHYTNPQDINSNLSGLDASKPYWFVQFKAAGLAYPLAITFSGYTTRQAEPGATAEFTFDAGSNPQMSQEWKPNQDIQLAGHTLKLVSISVDSRNGYSFKFKCDPDLISVDLEIVGYSNSGWGGGGGCYDGTYQRNLSYETIPTGLLTVRIANMVVKGDSLAWVGHWSPATPRTDLPANPTPQPGLCLTVDNLENLDRAPDNMANGKALVFEQLEGSDQYGLVLYNLADGQKKVIASSGNWGSLSPDGKFVAYSGPDNAMHIVDVDTLAEQVLPNASGFNLRWSPDGKRIAFVALGGGIIDSVFIVNTDGSGLRQVSTLSYEYVAGWSPDGMQLYFVAPFTGGAAWKVYAFDLNSGVATELFTIENGTPKFLNPKLSPDGQWIAYRGRDSSSLYLVRTDGSDMHLALENVGADGIEWTSSGWLGVSLMDFGTEKQTLVLVNPESCEAFQLLDVGGEMQGLFIP